MENKKICIEIAKREERSVIMMTDLKRNIEQYVGCSYFDNRKPYGEKWQWGHYFEMDIKGAMDWLYDVPKMPIPYDRLSELATLFKDGLIEDDEDSAMEYFRETCDMTEEEMKYFGVYKKKYDIVEVELEKTLRKKVKIAVPRGMEITMWNFDNYIDTYNIDNDDADDDDWNYYDSDIIKEEMTESEIDSQYSQDEIWNYDDYQED